MSVVPSLTCALLRLCSYFQHAVERDSRPVFNIFANLDSVYYISIRQIFQSPRQVLRRDAEHGRAQTSRIIQRDHPLAVWSKLLAHAIDQMNLGADRKHRASRSLFNDLDQL